MAARPIAPAITRTTEPARGATPGPWTVNKYGSVGGGTSGITPIIASVEPFYGPDEKYGDHSANALLIASAPELLDTVRALLDVISDAGQQFGVSFDGRDPVIAAVAALAKAAP